MGFHLIQLPAEKISAICVMHIVKQLFTKFVDESRQVEDELLATKEIECQFEKFQSSLSILMETWN